MGLLETLKGNTVDEAEAAPVVAKQPATPKTLAGRLSQGLDTSLPIDSTMGAFNRGLLEQTAVGNPTALAESLEALGVELDSPWLQNASKWARRQTAIGKGVKTETEGWSGFFDAPLTTVGERAGEAVGSTLPSIAGGTVGGFIGGRLGGKYGVVGGGILGAGLPSYALNHGDLYAALKAEGLPPKTAADWATGGAFALTALDVASPVGIVSRLTGAQRREAVRGLAKRIVGEALKQSQIEGGTEAAQQAIQQGLIVAATGRPFTGSDAKAVAEAYLSGTLGGSIFGAAGGIVPDSPDVGAPMSQEALEEALRDQGAPIPAPEPEPPIAAPAPPVSEPPAQPPAEPVPPAVPQPEPPVVEPEKPKQPPVADQKVPLDVTAPGPYYVSNVDDAEGSPVGKTNVGFSSRAAADKNIAFAGRRNSRLWALDRDKLAEGSFTSDLIYLPPGAADVMSSAAGIKGDGKAIQLARQAVLLRNKLIKAGQTQGMLPDQVDLSEADAVYAKAIEAGFRYNPPMRDASIIYLGPDPLTQAQVREVGHVDEPQTGARVPYRLTPTGAVPVLNANDAHAAGRLVDINSQLIPGLDLSMAPRTLFERLGEIGPEQLTFRSGTPVAAQEKLKTEFSMIAAAANPEAAYEHLLRQGLRVPPGNSVPMFVGDIPAYAMREVVAPAVGLLTRNRLGTQRYKGDEPSLAQNNNITGQKVSFGTQTGKPYDWQQHKPGTVAAIFNPEHAFLPVEQQRKIAQFTQLVIGRVAPQAKVVLTFMRDERFRWAYHDSQAQRFSHMNFWETPSMGVGETLVHEIGHLIAHQQLANAGPRIQSMIYAAWRRNVIVAAKGNFGEFMTFFGAPGRLLESLDYHSQAQFQQDARLHIKASYLWDWPYSFDEWFAEQTAKWFQTAEKPRTLVDRFFKGTADRVKQLYRLAAKKLGLGTEENAAEAIRAEPEVEAFLESVYTRRQAGLKPTGLTALAEGERTSQAENARLLNIPLDQAGPADSQHWGISQLVPQGMGVSKKQVAQLDRYSWFIKKTWGLLQFAAKNPHIAGLQRYVEMMRAWHNSKMGLISRADGRLKAWRALGKEMGQNLSQFLFAMDSMEYLPAGSNARWPTNAELVALAKKYNLNQDAVQLYIAIRGDFLHVLDRVEAAWRADAQRSIADPVALQQALASVTAEVNALRSRPYFPHERFGDWTLAVRDANNKLVFFQQFPTQKGAIKAAEEAQARYPQNHDVSTGRLPEDVRIFRGLPPTLLKSIANKLQLSQQQRDWLDMLIFDLSPANSAAKKFKKRSNIAGYSYEAQQAYANYFIHIGSHIARLEYGQALEETVKEVDDSATMMRGVYAAEAVHRRRGIAEWMRSTLDYVLNPTNELDAIKALTFTWFLGFNVSSALINLTQIPMVAAPYLSARFNEFKALNELRAAAIDLRKMYTLKQGKLPQDEIDAIGLGVAQGFLDETQASELAAAARGAGRLGALAGGFVSKSLMQMGYWSSYMFSSTEKWNRRVVFRAAYRLAKKNPQTQYLNELVVANPRLYQELLGQGWTPTNASAYLAGRDAVDRTMFEYARWNRPEFVRGKTGTLFAFWMFRQNILWYYKNSPGGTRALLVMLAAAGLMGLPGAEDLSAMVNWAMDKLGFRFNPKEEVRKFLVENITDPRTADLFMHGMGRESFGMPWVGEQMGIPLPNFDLSGRLGMGEVVPGLQPMMQTGTDYDTKFRQTIESLVGASYSIPLRIAGAMETGDPDTFKEWERTLPTAAKNLIKATRLAARGEETTRSGATVAEFDLLDAKSRLELVGQALGFTPTKLTRKWDLAEAQREAQSYWALQREELFDSFDFARRIKDREALAQVRADIREFNDTVPEPALRITTDSLIRSAKAREKSRTGVERGTGTSKTYRGLLKTLKGIYPEVED